MPEQYDVKVRAVPERAVLTATRRVHLGDADEVLGTLLGRMRTSGSGLTGVDGCPHLMHHAEVSADSDGPVEVVRPMADTRGRLHAPALAALERWVAEEGRAVAGPPRQVMIADWRSAGPDDPACLLSVPLGPVTAVSPPR